MKRVLAVVGVVAVVALSVAVAVWATRPVATPPADPVAVHFSKLPPAVYARGEHVGSAVRVAFYRPLTPTADPLVYLFHPGEPVEVVPATYRLHFDSPPAFTDAPFVVVGRVEGIDSDLVKRLNGVPGVLVLRACRSLPASR